MHSLYPVLAARSLLLDYGLHLAKVGVNAQSLSGTCCAFTITAVVATDTEKLAVIQYRIIQISFLLHVQTFYLSISYLPNPVTRILLLLLFIIVLDGKLS